AVAAAEFFKGPLMTAAQADECLEEISWPIWPEPRTGSAFSEISRRHGDFAIVAAAAQVALDANGRCARASFGLGGGGTAPRAFPDIAGRLAGTRLEEDTVKEAARAAAAEVDFYGDLHASAEYRRHLAEVLAARVLREAFERAGGNGPPANHR